jgi:hypothetical protein|tara:strand:- start:783 stop:1016 length:234 start_codon:yes stop_codon:yes gene_type:complete
MNNEINERALEAVYNKGIHFKLDSGRTISIQQKRDTYSIRNKSVEVGTWVTADDEIKVYENVSLNELIELLIKLKGE